MHVLSWRYVLACCLPRAMWTAGGALGALMVTEGGRVPDMAKSPPNRARANSRCDRIMDAFRLGRTCSTCAGLPRLARRRPSGHNDIFLCHLKHRRSSSGCLLYDMRAALRNKEHRQVIPHSGCGGSSSENDGRVLLSSKLR